MPWDSVLRGAQAATAAAVECKSMLVQPVRAGLQEEGAEWDMLRARIVHEPAAMRKRATLAQARGKALKAAAGWSTRRARMLPTDTRDTPMSRRRKSK
jgi:hypothetical protein